MVLHKEKYKRLCPGLELASPYQLPSIIIITQRTPQTITLYMIELIWKEHLRTQFFVFGLRLR